MVCNQYLHVSLSLRLMRVRCSSCYSIKCTQKAERQKLLTYAFLLKESREAAAIFLLFHHFHFSRQNLTIMKLVLILIIVSAASGSVQEGRLLELNDGSKLQQVTFISPDYKLLTVGIIVFE